MGDALRWASRVGFVWWKERTAESLGLREYFGIHLCHKGFSHVRECNFRAVPSEQRQTASVTEAASSSRRRRSESASNRKRRASRKRSASKRKEASRPTQRN
eukprot:s5365_g5.t1